MGQNKTRLVRVTPKTHGDLEDLRDEDEDFGDVVRMLVDYYAMKHPGEPLERDG